MFAPPQSLILLGRNGQTLVRVAPPSRTLISHSSVIIACLVLFSLLNSVWTLFIHLLFCITLGPFSFRIFLLIIQFPLTIESQKNPKYNVSPSRLLLPLYFFTQYSAIHATGVLCMYALAREMYVVGVLLIDSLVGFSKEKQHQTGYICTIAQALMHREYSLIEEIQRDIIRLNGTPGCGLPIGALMPLISEERMELDVVGALVERLSMVLLADG